MASAWIRPLMLILPLALGLGCVRTGYLRFGEPRVHDSTTTRAVLGRSGSLLAKEVRRSDLASIQEFAASRELTSLSGRAATTGSELPEAAGAGGLPDLPSAELEFGRTVPEQAHDFRHREGRAVEVELLYDGTGNATYLGRNARVYLLSFEMGLFPTRQSRLLYPALWLWSAFGDSYNFTKDWFAHVEFIIPELARPGPGSEGAPDISVYEIVPRYDVLTAREAAAAASQLQLAAAGAAAAGRAQIDYLRRLEEQFAQQRRYPLQLGMIENEHSWSWSFGTRRQLRKRSALISWIPFVNRYTTDARLEPGMRTGHVILLLKDIDDFALTGAGNCFGSPRLAGDPNSVIEETRTQDSEYRWAGQEQSTRTAVKTLGAVMSGREKRDDPCAENHAITLPIVVRASYLKLDRPSRRVPFRISGTAPEGTTFTPDPGSALPITVDLPLAPEPAVVPSATRVAHATRWDATHFLVELDLGARKLDARDVRQVHVRDESRKRPLRVTRYELFDESTVHAIVALPDPPGGSTCSPDMKPPCIELSGRIVTANADLRSGTPHAPYTGPWSQPATRSLALSPVVGGTGTRASISIGEALRNAAQRPTSASNVSRVLFGTSELKKGVSGWWVAPTKDAVSFQVPLPPKGASAVDVIVEFDNGRAPTAAGTFLYR